MKHLAFTFIIITLTTVRLSAQTGCINPDNLKALDAAWEQSLMETNLAFFESTVHEDFIWVHDHAGQVDDKNALLALVRKVRTEKPDHWKSRMQSEVRLIIAGTTGVVNGFTEVQLQDGSNRNYNYMRTYAEENGKCYLVANHTMAIPENE
jgi:hypothetical protein